MLLCWPGCSAFRMRSGVLHPPSLLNQTLCLSAAVRALTCFNDAVCFCDASAEGWPIRWANEKWDALTGEHKGLASVFVGVMGCQYCAVGRGSWANAKAGQDTPRQLF